MPDIKCSVNTCHYWGKGEVCTADAIEVAITGHADPRSDAGSIGKPKASRSEETQCVTFRPRS